MLEDEQQSKYILVDAPLVEGAFAAGITASVSDDIEHILIEAKNAPGKGWE
jgi:dihydroxyacetone kinase DhaKLM complex PTS-EIIA-like component DhaM